jgi:1-acyl-sn-glycerol-3-phosphate acyltransferase
MRSRYYAILSIPVFGILYSYTAILVLVVLVFAWLNMKKPIRYLQQKWAKSVFIIMGKKFRIEGLENIDKSKKYILVANHSSLFDIVAIVSFFPEISWFGHERLLKVPLFNKVLKMTDYVPFRDPNYRNTKQMINQLIQRSKDQSVAIFPEGTRTINGRINVFFKGFIYLFRTSHIDILPVTLNGFYKLKPKNRSYIDFGSKLSVFIHKPITCEELENKTDHEIINRVRSVILSKYC